MNSGPKSQILLLNILNSREQKSPSDIVNNATTVLGVNHDVVYDLLKQLHEAQIPLCPLLAAKNGGNRDKLIVLDAPLLFFHTLVRSGLEIGGIGDFAPPSIEMNLLKIFEGKMLESWVRHIVSNRTSERKLAITGSNALNQHPQLPPGNPYILYGTFCGFKDVEIDLLILYPSARFAIFGSVKRSASQWDAPNLVGHVAKLRQQMESISKQINCPQNVAEVLQLALADATFTTYYLHIATLLPDQDDLSKFFESTADKNNTCVTDLNTLLTFN